MINKKKSDEFNLEVKLHINEKLFEKGFITEEMHRIAKQEILKGNTEKAH